MNNNATRHFIATDFEVSSLDFTGCDTYEKELQECKKFLAGPKIKPVECVTYIIKGVNHVLTIYTDNETSLFFTELISQYIDIYEGYHQSQYIYDINDIYIKRMIKLIRDVGYERGWFYWTGQKS